MTPMSDKREKARQANTFESGFALVPPSAGLLLRVRKHLRVYGVKATVGKIPSFVANRIKRYGVQGQFRSQFHRTLPSASPRIMQFANFFPHQPEEDSYTLPAYATNNGERATSRPPVPPRNLWVNYGTSDDEYLEGGRCDVAAIRQILAQAGSPIETAKRILEFGCAAGRLIRWLDDIASSREIWGVDIWASAIYWCKEHLSPPFYFATTTITPHLPFEDRYFDLILAGSVFTHIEDLTDAWFLELRRILRPGGKLYFTLNDRRAIAVIEGQATRDEFEAYYKRGGGKKSWESFVNGCFRASPNYQAFRRNEADMVTINRSASSHVMWDADYLCKRQEPFYRTLSITPKAYGHQTGVLFERT